MSRMEELSNEDIQEVITELKTGELNKRKFSVGEVCEELVEVLEGFLEIRTQNEALKKKINDFMTCCCSGCACGNKRAMEQSE